MIFRRSDNKNLGKQGEGVAVEFLKKQGYRVVERNYRTRKGEIDVVCEHSGCIIFVEVKTRRSLAFGHPEEAVDERKQRRMAQIAVDYLTENSLWGKVDCRFDVVAIFEDNPRSLKHIVDAFRL